MSKTELQLLNVLHDALKNVCSISVGENSAASLLWIVGSIQFLEERLEMSYKTEDREVYVESILEETKELRNALSEFTLFAPEVDSMCAISEQKLNDFLKANQAFPLM